MSDEWDSITKTATSDLSSDVIAVAAIEILRELMVDVARLKVDPEQYLVGLYERVVTHLEEENGNSRDFGNRDAADYVEAIFHDSLRTLRDL